MNAAQRLTPDDVAAVVGVVERLSGLWFDEVRRPALLAAVHERLTARGTDDVSGYLDLLEHGTDDVAEAERREVLDAITIRETYFFRNAPQMEALRHLVLPDLVHIAASARRPLRMWSAGCATGEEAYTLAMLALETMDRLGLFVPVEIVGTDVSAAAVDHAQRAEYSGRTLDLAEAGARARWFVPTPSGREAVHPDVRSLVEVRRHNLVADEPPFGPGDVDLVVCRNVTIYFAKPTTAAVMRTFRTALAGHGYLMVGHAETLWQVSDDFDLVPAGEAFVYRPAASVAACAPTDERRPRARWARRRRPEAVPAVRRPVPLAAPRVPEPDAVATLASADRAVAEGRYRDAMHLARAVASVDPLCVRAYTTMGLAGVADGDDDAAVDALRRAVFLDPGCAEAHFLLAGCLDRQGNGLAAAASYRAAAIAVPTTGADALQRLLDGRDPASLVELCEQLADLAQRGGVQGVGPTVPGVR